MIDKMVHHLKDVIRIFISVVTFILSVKDYAVLFSRKLKRNGYLKLKRSVSRGISSRLSNKITIQ